MLQLYGIKQHTIFVYQGMLAGKTRLLVTHNISNLQVMHRIVVMKDGRISEVGTYQELLQRQADFGEFLNQFSHQVLISILFNTRVRLDDRKQMTKSHLEYDHFF